MIYVDWIPSLPILEGEAKEDRLCRFVRLFNEVSLDNQAYLLEELVCRGVDTPSSQSWLWRTNCGTSALGFLAACCGNLENSKDFHPLLAMPSKIGTSPNWLFRMGHDLSLVEPYHGGPIYKGQLVTYSSGDHFEWVLSDMSPMTGIAVHGGGGRPHNEITVGQGDIRTSLGRRITHVFNFVKNLPESPDPAVGEVERVYMGPEEAPT